MPITRLILREILTRIDRIERKPDLFIEELHEEEIEEIKEGIGELVGRTREGGV